MTILNPDLLSGSEAGIYILEWAAEKKNTRLNGLVARKPFVKSSTQKSEELRRYNLV